MKLGSAGELVPEHGFSRRPYRRSPAIASAWVSTRGLLVLSGRPDAYLPGTGTRTDLAYPAESPVSDIAPQIGPQWLISVSRTGPAELAARRPSDDEIAHVVEAFAMPAVDEDNHHPGAARHLWCPVDPAYRSACECKLTELTIVEADGYRWTTEAGECRGCWYERMFGHPCPRHRQEAPV